jgi:hypothetical protein
MDEFGTTSDTLDHVDEEVLTDTASDEELEAAAGTESGRLCLFTPVTVRICGCWS